MSERTPAHSLEAEMAVLGACMADRDAATACLPLLREADFYAHIHADIFAAIAELSDAGKPHDYIAVADVLRTKNKLDAVGGAAYLSKLVRDSLETVSSAEYYAKLIREKAVLYRLYKAAHKIADIALDGEVDVAEAVADAEKALHSAVGGFNDTKTGGHINGLLIKAFREIQAASEGHIIAQGTPWNHLDGLTGGWYGGEMVAWFGRPKDGKSSAVAQLMQYVAEHFGAVVLFALEMGEDSVVRRLIGNRAHIDSRKLRRGALLPHDWERLSDAMSSLSGLPIYIHSSARSVSEMRRTLLSLSAKVPVKAFIVDHIAFVTDVLNGERGSSEHDRLNRAYLRILNLAKELDCVAHVVTHANRAGYDKEPTMAHIRGGGNLEGHAHTIIAPYRDNPEEDPQSGKFLVLANREGRTGAIPMRFEGERNTWTQIQVDRVVA